MGYAAGNAGPAAAPALEALAPARPGV